MGREAAIAIVAASQHGAFTHRQALEVGFSKDAILHRRRSGVWQSIRHGVYAAAGAPRTWEQEVMAARLSCGVAVASHTTAAALLGIHTERGRPIHLTVHQHQRPKSAIVLHQARLTRTDIRKIDNIPVTAPNRTLVDLAGVLSRPALEAALDDAVQAGLTTIVTLRRYIRDRRLEHRPGVKVLRQLLDERVSGSSQKALERLFIKKLRGTDLPKPSRQFRVRSYKVDFVYRDARIAIELDGLGTHFSGEAFRADRRRQNELVLEGWIPLRFTWDDVNQSWPRVEATIRAALAPQ